MYLYEFGDMKKYCEVTLKNEFARTIMSSYILIYTNSYPYQKEVDIPNVFIRIRWYEKVLRSHTKKRIRTHEYV
jgi:hypothetical protein